MIEILNILLEAPDRQLDATMVERLRVLLKSDPTDDQLRIGLKDILDLSAHFALASDFVMTVLDEVWRSVGGKLDDPPSETFLREKDRRGRR